MEDFEDELANKLTSYKSKLENLHSSKKDTIDVSICRNLVINVVKFSEFFGKVFFVNLHIFRLWEKRLKDKSFISKFKHLAPCLSTSDMMLFAISFASQKSEAGLPVAPNNTILSHHIVSLTRCLSFFRGR